MPTPSHSRSSNEADERRPAGGYPLRGDAVDDKGRKTLEAIRSGDRAACAELVHAHYAAVYAFLAHVTGDRALAEDLTQETFAAAWTGISTFRGEASLRTWLHGIAYRKFVDAKRRSKLAERAVDHIRASAAGGDGEKGPAEAASRDELAQAICRAIGELDGDGRTTIVLHYFQGLSFDEMAEVLGRPIGTVKWQTSQALKALRKSLDGKV